MPVEAKQVRDLFLSAAEAPDAERAAYLDRACGADGELRAAVERLLGAHTEPASVLEPRVLPFTDLYSSQFKAGKLLAGRYKLLEEIGEGGMGAVWVAQQTEPIKRTVALKLIKPGMHSKTVLARFEAERQALALMDHPNIARVLDAGVTSEGRPFFVMELVKGVPITQFCDARRLNPRERLELFVQVCQAVQHAHQKGIIHRDLKPSNVLVALYDDKAVPKVIDFGVAKAVGQSLTAETLHTGFGTIIGTPQYMSPEQATFNNLDVDTRSDLYSLGVLLYELLVGSTPFTRQDLEKAGVLEMLRVVREEEPLRPSTKLSTAAALPTLAANRSTEPKRLTGLLRNELDWVVMKALEKDRTRRYETANGLAADVQRYLAGEPVLAVPPSAGYRLRKFTKKHRGRVAAAAVLLVSVIGAAVAIAYGVTESRNQREANLLRDQAVQGRDAAEEERKNAEAARQATQKALEEKGKALKDLEAATEGVKAARASAEADRDLLAQERAKLAWVEYSRTIQRAHQEWRGNNVLAAVSLLNSTPEELRGWEWNYLKRLCDEQLITLRGHGFAVVSAVFSPDGKLVLTASRDGTARVWDAVTGDEIAAFKGHRAEVGHEAEVEVVNSAAFSPDGQWAVTSGNDRTARVWDVKTGAQIAVMKGHEQKVISAVFSLDGKQVLTASHDGTARIWDAASGRQVRSLQGHGNQVLSARYSTDGKWVVTASSDGTARVCNAASGAEQAILKGHTDAVISAAFSPDSKLVLTASNDKTARLWHAPSGEPIATLSGHTDRLSSAVFRHDGQRVLTTSADGTARIWDASGNSLVTLKGHTLLLHTGVFSADGRQVLTASADGTARIWDAENGAELRALKGHTQSLLAAVYSPDGKEVLTASVDRTARIWSSNVPAESTVFHQRAAKLVSAAYSRDGHRVVMACQGMAEIYDASSRAFVVKLPIDPDQLIFSANFSPDGQQVATGSSDNLGRLWDAATGAELRVLKGHTDWVTSAVFSPDGRWILTASNDKTVRLWNAASGVEEKVFTGHTDKVHSAVFSPNGRQILTASEDHTVRVWKVATGETLATFEVPMGFTPAAPTAVFSPDGQRILTGTIFGYGQLWDAVSGTLIATFKGHALLVTSAVFSPDGKRLLTGSLDGTTRIWDATYGSELAVLKVQTTSPSGINFAVFSPDGQRVLTAACDGSTRIWDASPGPALLEHYREAVRLDPKKPKAHARLAIGLAKSGDRAGAIGSYQKAIELNSAVERYHADLARLLLEDARAKATVLDYRAAFAMLEELAAKYRATSTYRAASAKLRFLMGKLSFEQDLPADALSDYRRGLEIIEHLAAADPADPVHRAEMARGHRELAECLHRLGKPAEAMAEYRTAQQILEALAAQYPRQTQYATELAAIEFIMGKQGGAWRGKVPGNGHCNNLQFSPDGQYFLLGGDMGTFSPFRIYSTRTGELIHNLQSESDRLWSAARFNGDGSKIVSWRWASKSFYLWDMATGKRLQTFEGHLERVDYADFSPDGKRIVSGSEDRTLRIWDAATGRELRKLVGHRNTCIGQFSRDGKLIVSYGVDGTIRGWDAITGAELWWQPHQAATTCEILLVAYERCFSANHSWVLSLAEDGSVCVWEAATGKAVTPPLVGKGEAKGAVFIKGGSQVATWGKDHTLRFWDLPDGKLAAEFELGNDLAGQPDNVAVSPDGAYVLTGHDNQIMRFRNLATGKTQDFRIEAESVTRGLRFSPDLKTAVAGSFRGWVYAWRLPVDEKKP